jgi:cytochrome c553
MAHRHYSGPLLFLALTAAGAGPPREKAPAPSFAADIQPLFQAKCLRCHGQKVRRAGLDLRTLAGALQGGESGPAVVPGKPDESPLYEKVHTGAMPPGKKDRLAEAEVETIRRWIAAGARSGPGEAANTWAGAAPTQHDVLPILLRRCTACHGRHRQEGGLDLRTKSAMLRGGKSGPAIVPGRPEASPLIKKVRVGEMPPRTRLVEASVKPAEPAEVEILARWIAAGAPEVAVEPDVATKTPDPLVTAKDRDFWAFRAPGPVAVPSVRHADRVRSPIDAFILQKLERKGLTLSPEPDRATLARRASFDLTGLAPEPAEVRAFLADRAPDAYERMIDRLLASPRYGERWGRFWLDLAGYADSEGKREQDLPRPHAWRYRDYVVRSFNADKPYTRFLLEQIAGDELADYESAPEVTPELYDNLVATGFLRMAPDATWANITGYVTDRLEVIADEMDVLGSAVLGLTLKCARCHSHKFDPIPQRDYYRLLAVFKGAYDEHDWLKPDVRAGLGPVSQDVLGGRHLPHVTSAEGRAWEAHNAPILKEIAALESSAGKKGAEAKVKALRAKLQPEPRVQALWDRGHPTPTYIYRRGDPQSPGRLVGPGVPSVLSDGRTPFEVKPPWPGAKKTGRRLAFARWLVRSDHPLTTRVAVNRIWKHHFGTGIVKTLGNFGKAGSPPTHPELLDWLAREFVRRGWSVKSLHRLMMTSSTYRQSSAVTPDREKLDPGNALYSRMPLVRLDAEALYDTLLLVAGRLDECRFGPADPVQVRPDGLVTPAGSARGWRRLIYVRQARKQLPTHLENFDYPQMNPNCLERRDSTVAPQALHLMNNGMVHRLAEHFSQRVSREAGADVGKQIERVYWLAMSRPPGREEMAVGLAALSTLTDQWAKHLSAAGKPSREAARKALATYCHAVMNSAGFLYVD